ncbi:MAG TPA: phosphonate ABC transporter, permease protein PhnE [Candidatus Deferrimicrobiaceae bacterium]|nr:phosphonate ABC transporter, permease protein PhnE [Candidatus Deferrimicrobiaceae bacterium]
MSEITAPGRERTERPTRPSNAKRNAGLLFVLLLIVVSVLSVDIKIERIVDLPAGIWLVIYKMYFERGPDLSYLGTSIEYMIQSIQIAWVGTIIGAVLSLPIGFVAAKNVSSGLISNVFRQVLNGIRAFPELVLAVAIFIPIAGLGEVAGALAIGIHSIGTLGKLTAEVVEGIDPGPVEAARAAGGRWTQIQRWGVLPPVLPEIVAFWLYRFEINIRAAAVLGVVGAGGIGFIVQQTIVFGRFPLTGTALLVVIVATIFVDTISGWVRRRIIEGAETRRIVDAEIEAPALNDAAAVRP